MTAAKEHDYSVAVTWTGNDGAGTVDYRAYRRDHEIAAPGRPTILGSSDPAFRGDPTRWNPEELLVAAVSQCHMLWFLHLAASAGVSVVEYVDRPTGTMIEEPGGVGQFREVTLRPEVTINDPAQLELAESLHHQAGQVCFIARSVNFPIRHDPVTKAG